MRACVYCGQLGLWRQHHPTERDENGVYLDPDFTVPACHDHHTLVHDDCRSLGLEEVADPLGATELNALRLRRLAVNLARVSSPEGAVVLLQAAARFLPCWADELQGIVTLLGR